MCVCNIYVIYITNICIKLRAWLSGYGVRHTSSRTRVRASSGPLINFIKWVLEYYLEVILYNCV